MINLLFSTLPANSLGLLARFIFLAKRLEKNDMEMKLIGNGITNYKTMFVLYYLNFFLLTFFILTYGFKNKKQD